MTSSAERLSALLSGSPRNLDRLMAVIATVAPDPPAEEDIVDQFDQMASGIGPEPTAEMVMSHVHGELGFIGNTANYYSPSNSFVHWVLRERRGIPLSLAAVGVEIGRRVGVDLTIVGLPGHVVLGDGRQPRRWFDPFSGGAELDMDDCRRLFARFNPVESFSEEMLKPIGPTASTIRMLNNLKVCYRNLGDLSQLAKVLELSVNVPGTGAAERHEFATVLAALGRDEQAAEQRDLLAKLDPKRADSHRSAANRHRARRN